MDLDMEGAEKKDEEEEGEEGDDGEISMDEGPRKSEKLPAFDYYYRYASRLANGFLGKLY